MSLKVFAIREKFGHMGGHSGYDLIFEDLVKEFYKEVFLNTYWRNQNKMSFFERKFYSFLNNKIVSATPFYNLNSCKTEFLTGLYAQFLKPEIIHIAYLENNFGFHKYYKSLHGIQTVATIHQPPSWWKLIRVDKNILKHIDKLIVLDSKSKEYFSEFLPSNQIFLSKHPVDSDFFCPLNISKTDNWFNCIFSGHWLRDIGLLIKVIEYISSFSENKIRFHLVYPSNNKENKFELYYLARLSNVFWYNNLTDKALHQLYNKADVFFCPLIDSTANNGILEAMSCGLPIITTPVGGILDYVSEDFTFLSFEYKKIGDYIIEMSKNIDYVKMKGMNARKYVLENLTIRKMSTEVLNIYSC